MRWAGHVACMEGVQVHAGFCGKPEGKRSFGGHRCSLKNNI